MESKRLHISGLTPQITAGDLIRRFSSFGTVKALDALGKLDALGNPRPYAYLTLEATKPQLAKCAYIAFYFFIYPEYCEGRPQFAERHDMERCPVTHWRGQA